MESREEQTEWAKTFPPKPAREHVAYDASDAYEWGDPKNPAYIEWAMEEAERYTDQ